jgi:hypothetical protein
VKNGKDLVTMSETPITDLASMYANAIKSGLPG